MLSCFVRAPSSTESLSPPSQKEFSAAASDDLCATVYKVLGVISALVVVLSFYALLSNGIADPSFGGVKAFTASAGAVFGADGTTFSMVIFSLSTATGIASVMGWYVNRKPAPPPKAEKTYSTPPSAKETTQDGEIAPPSVSDSQASSALTTNEKQERSQAVAPSPAIGESLAPPMQGAPSAHTPTALDPAAERRRARRQQQRAQHGAHVHPPLALSPPHGSLQLSSMGSAAAGTVDVQLESALQSGSLAAAASEGARQSPGALSSPIADGPLLSTFASPPSPSLPDPNKLRTPPKKAAPERLGPMVFTTPPSPVSPDTPPVPALASVTSPEIVLSRPPPFQSPPQNG